MRTRHAASIALAGCATLWLGAAQVAPTQQQSGANPAAHADTVAWLRYVADETRKLRIEVSELRLAVEGARIPELERSLVAAQSERQCLEQEISDYSQQVLSLDSQLAQPGIAAEEQQQLFARKAELSAEMSGRLRQRQDLLAAQETAARDRLDNQRRTIRAALAHKSELTAGTHN